MQMPELNLNILMIYINCNALGHPPATVKLDSKTRHCSEGYSGAILSVIIQLMKSYAMNNVNANGFSFLFSLVVVKGDECQSSKW